MASVFELFGRQRDSNSTTLPPLGINSRLNTLQTQSQKFYFVGDNAKAMDGNILAVTVEKNQGFSLKNNEHVKHLRACTELFKEKSAALKSIDQNIAISLLVGVIASALSFIPFVGYFSLIGWGGALYFMNQRTKAYDEYNEALNLLAATCNWSLGQGEGDRTSSKDELTENTDIRDMMTSLYPVVTEKQARHLIADDIEDVFADELRRYENKYQLTANSNSFYGDESIARSKRGAESSRCIYGLNKGNPTDFLDAFISVFPDIWNALRHGCQRLQYWWTNRSGATEGKDLDSTATNQVK